MGLRLKNGLPRGGLGRVGWPPALGAFVAAWFAPAGWAACAGLLTAPVCLWCALGLRADDAAGEVSDHYVDDDSYRWGALLSGDFEHPVRRDSTGLVLLSAASCLVALFRWRYGWGPLG